MISHEEFVDKIKNINDTLIIVSKYKSGNQPIRFRCAICNRVQKKKCATWLKTRGCAFCSYSKGEIKIRNLLEKNNVKFEKQYSFKELKVIKNGKEFYLTFDFAIFDQTGKLIQLIEYDGIQHFYSVSTFGGKDRLLNQTKNDILKNEFCKQNNIKLIRISYKEYRSLTFKDLEIT